MTPAGFSAIAGAAQGLMDTGVGIWQQLRTWKREDTAVQRRVRDLRAAGLSPTLAAGSAAQTQGPVSIKPSAAIDKAAVAMALMRQKADISKTAAETKLIEMVQDEQQDKLNLLRRTFHDRERSAFAGAEIASQQSDEMGMKVQVLMHNLALARKFGWMTTGGDFRTRLGMTGLEMLERYLPKKFRRK